MRIQQQAIIVTRDNVNDLADSLIDYSAQNILDEAEPLWNNHHVPILVREVVEPGVHVVSHIVSLSMFLANAKPADTLSDSTFVTVVQL